MDPSAPPQPPKSTAYETQSNPATSNTQEQHIAQDHHHRPPAENVAERMPPPAKAGGGMAEATPSSLGYGIRGAPAGEERYGHTKEQVSRARELEGEQMRAPGEGDVAEAVERKPGAGGEQPDLAGDLDRKKNEQAAMREAVKEKRRRGEAPDDGDVRAGVGI